MEKFMKVKMVKTPVSRQYILEWWYRFNGVPYMVDFRIVKELKSWL